MGMANPLTTLTEEMQTSYSTDIPEDQNPAGDLPFTDNTSKIETISIITLCSIGLASNSCAFVLILKTSLFKNTNGVYLAFISVLDNLCLIFHSIPRQIWLTNNFSCDKMWILTILLPRLSWHVLVWMTIDRCYNLVNTYKPNTERRSAFTISTVVICLTTAVYLMLLWNTHGIATISNDGHSSAIRGNGSFFDKALPKATNNRTVCEPLPLFRVYMISVFLPGDLIIFRMFVPITVVICNVIIIVHLKKNSTVAPVNVNTTQSNQDKKITRLLVVVSLCYVLFTVPKGIYFLLIPHLYDDVSEAISGRNPAFLVVNNLFLLNHCANLYLYLLSSKTFRDETKLVFKTLWNINLSRATPFGTREDSGMRTCGRSDNTVFPQSSRASNPSTKQTGL